MKIKDYEKIKRNNIRVRKIKKEIDLFGKEKDYTLEQIDEKTWLYRWFEKESE